MPEFSTNEALSLEKSVNIASKLTETEPENVEKVYEIDRCVQWIRTNNFQKVCLQFPDNLLPDSSQVALGLQKALGQTVYVLADTAYESCCIDYVGAAHINGDAVIHFGPICFSKTSSNVPCLYIYEKRPLDIEKLTVACQDFLHNCKITPIILLDSPYIHCKGDVEGKFPDISIKSIDCDSLKDLTESLLIYIGSNDRMLLNLQLTYKPCTMYSFDPESSESPALLCFEQHSTILRRRYYLVEKIKDSNTVGIVIGTLGVKNYLLVIERIKKLLRLRGKKYYVISVGKPTVAKLANFPEIDIYVIITCALNEIYDSRDYYKPIVTPYDVELALNPTANGLSFTYEYNDFINRPIPDEVPDENDVSLITGKVRSSEQQASSVGGTELAVRSDGTVGLNSSFGAGYLAAKSWKGLEQNLGMTDIKDVEEGRIGIAQGYKNEAEHHM